MWRPFLLALVVAGCNVGPGDTGGDDDMPPANPDAGSSGPPMWPDSGPGGPGMMVECVDRVPNPPDGHHFAGRDCMEGCHNHGFTLAGSLYTSVTGNTAFPGATITIVDANNVKTDLVVRQNGNFYSSQNFAFPVKVRASSCPLGKDMVATSATGRCNMAGCHAQSGGIQMHLP